MIRRPKQPPPEPPPVKVEIEPAAQDDPEVETRLGDVLFRLLDERKAKR
jgi:hypothetical protein